MNSITLAWYCNITKKCKYNFKKRVNPNPTTKCPNIIICFLIFLTLALVPVLLTFFQKYSHFITRFLAMLSIKLGYYFFLKSLKTPLIGKCLQQ